MRKLIRFAALVLLLAFGVIVIILSSARPVNQAPAPETTNDTF
jgi:hypothetical protein